MVSLSVAIRCNYTEEGWHDVFGRGNNHAEPFSRDLSTETHCSERHWKGYGLLALLSHPKSGFR